ncbi:LOW QUALITY PROTEIN: probable pectinesterase/pectinesterase inhibitor 21 [Hibiscus syriacus]|uniref:LOW QUALITY PROTEIN: probable pectinesterase/pectinesterase inhibitor 21 n=1 Tax=Hibiscus syriacus TaxID=106335 RepID=UPI001924DCE8|nr:LOW QUALITY PROTEIN: probable pectinesterase/pectinesterase inhibitor 21 [Hibiscus syriacus]
MGKAPAIIGVCSVILVAMVVAVAVGVSRSKTGGGSDEPMTSTKAVQSICQPTDYKHACENSLAGANTTDPRALIQASFHAAIREIEKVLNNSGTIQDAVKDPMSRQALDDCKELMGYSIDDLKNSFDQLGAFDVSKLDEYVENLKIWMSGSITYQQTCLDGFVNVSTEAGEKMRKLLNTSQMLTSNSLAMVTEIPKLVSDLNITGFAIGGAKRRLMAKDGFPSWVSFRQRMLLQRNPSQIRPNVIVAKDGSGKYNSINQALKEVPKNNASPFVIHIKAGVYNEQVIVDKHMSNVVFIGDGPTRTTITGRLNFADGTSTFRTATVAVIGPKFMAKNIGFENSAGAIKHQAVAIKVQSDQSIFHNCQMDGYQDTLYSHSHRQYYRDCTVSGTIDFVFGNAASVYQNCKLIVRKPLDNQQCIVTAQGRSERREATGFVLQNCSFTGAPNYLPVKERSKTYLGRPWKQYSRTIIMQSQLDDIVTGDGWMPWMGNFALDTLWYAEFNNRGPGAVQTNRVKWKGIQKINAVQAQQFTAGVFLRGADWIQNSGIPYIAGMIPGL